MFSGLNSDVFSFFTEYINTTKYVWDDRQQVEDRRYVIVYNTLGIGHTKEHPVEKRIPSWLLAEKQHATRQIHQPARCAEHNV